MPSWELDLVVNPILLLLVGLQASFYGIKASSVVFISIWDEDNCLSKLYLNTGQM